MVLYICSNCNKEFKKKCNYDYHIENKKKPCNAYSPNQNPNINLTTGLVPDTQIFIDQSSHLIPSNSNGLILLDNQIIQHDQQIQKTQITQETPMTQEAQSIQSMQVDQMIQPIHTIQLDHTTQCVQSKLDQNGQMDQPDQNGKLDQIAQVQPINSKSLVKNSKKKVEKNPEFSEKKCEISNNQMSGNNIIEIIMNKPYTNDNDNENKCIYCDKIFTRIDNLQRHLNGRCKSKGGYDDLEKIKEDMKIIMKNFMKLENNYQNLENNYQNLENVNVNLQKEIDVIKTNHQTTPDGVKNKTINNQINKGVILNNTLNIQIVQFGNEDIDKLNLTDAMKTYLKSTGGNIASNMLTYINLNKDYPENNNICMTDMSREIVKMHNGKKFVYKKFKNVKEDILNKVVDNTRKLIDKFKNDESYKKSTDTKNKLKINEVSLKIIDGVSAEDIVRDEINEKEKHLIKKKNDDDDDSGSDVERDFTFEERLRIEHLEKKREGMQKKTFENIKDGLYNAKELMEKH
jgi:hypothetical protein